MFTARVSLTAGQTEGSERLLHVLEIVRPGVSNLPGGPGFSQPALREEVVAEAAGDEGGRPEHEAVDQAEQDEGLDLAEAGGEFEPAVEQAACEAGLRGHRSLSSLSSADAGGR